jgi:alpha-amylase
MCTKWFSDGDVHKYFNPYNSPYDAFVNYMNVLSDFSHRVNSLSPKVSTEGMGAYEMEKIIKQYQSALKKIKNA